jgi:hypothetical protein
VAEERLLVPELRVLLDLKRTPGEVLLSAGALCKVTHHLSEVVTEQDRTVRLGLVEEGIAAVSLQVTGWPEATAPRHCCPNSQAIAGVTAERGDAYWISFDRHIGGLEVVTDCLDAGGGVI